MPRSIGGYITSPTSLYVIHINFAHIDENFSDDENISNTKNIIYPVQIRKALDKINLINLLFIIFILTFCILRVHYIFSQLL